MNSGALLPGSGYQTARPPPTRRATCSRRRYAQVLHVLGKDNNANLPPDAQDVRFFWKAVRQALVKYFEVAGNANGTALGTHENANDIDVYDPTTGFPKYSPIYDDDFFFDSDRRRPVRDRASTSTAASSSTTQGPTDFVVTADVKNGIFDRLRVLPRALPRRDGHLLRRAREPGDPLGQGGQRAA